MKFGHFEDLKPKKEKEPNQQICAVMSMPRLGFNDNWRCAVRAFGACGINYKTLCGAFWGQTLERVMMECIAEGYDYIITLDYDSWFTPQHVMVLAQLMLHSQLMFGEEADAIIPVQIMREHRHPMFTVHGPDGRRLSEGPPEWFMQPLTPVSSGHFGLTMFRVAKLQHMPHPWFMSTPDPTGCWGADRLDEDMYFWKKFREHGLRAYLANGLSLGHMELVVTFPGTQDTNWEPVPVHIQDAEKGHIPAYCKPQPVVDPEVYCQQQMKGEGHASANHPRIPRA